MSAAGTAAAPPTSATAAPPGQSKASYGYLQMKCLEALKRAAGPVHIQELQMALGRDYPIATDKAFLMKLRANPRVKFDPVTKTWSFTSPYQSLTSRDSILARLRSKELEVNQEVLELNKDISTWINE